MWGNSGVGKSPQGGGTTRARLAGTTPISRDAGRLRLHTTDMETEDKAMETVVSQLLQA